MENPENQGQRAQQDLQAALALRVKRVIQVQLGRKVYRDYQGLKGRREDRVPKETRQEETLASVATSIRQG